MGVGTRIVYTVFLILIIAVSVFVFMAALGLLPAADVEGVYLGFTSSAYRYIWAGAALVLAVVAVFLMFAGAKKKEPSSVLLHTGPDGSVCISVAALIELSQRYLNEVYGINTERIVILPLSERNVRVNLYLSVKPEVEMPQITGTVTQGIREYLEKYSGINASYVNIKIMPVRNVQVPAR